MRIISDIHLGSKICETKLVNRFLDEYNDMLIVNGDLVDHWKMHKWKKSHLVLLDRFRNRKNTIFVAGNHEESMEVATQVTGIQWVNSIVLGQQIYVCHGHQWDKWIGRWPLAEDLIDMVYGSLNKKTAKLFKHAFKNMIKCISHEACKLEYDAVICGHTHQAMHLSKYWNCGCWTESPGTWVQIDNGVISLRSL